MKGKNNKKKKQEVNSGMTSGYSPLNIWNSPSPYLFDMEFIQQVKQFTNIIIEDGLLIDQPKLRSNK